MRSLSLMALLVLVVVTPQALAQPQNACNHARPSCSTLVVETANSAARQTPATGSFSAARQIYAYAPGAIYQAYANPNFVTAILLEPGETINAVAAGDTSRWQVSETDGEGRPIVLIKPHEAGLKTNIVLVTDRRTYLVEAEAVSGGAYSAQIAWSYPQGVAPVAPTPDFHFGYRVRTIRGVRPVWTPSVVYDDGARTWIEFPVGASTSDLPPLFVLGPDGPELVNYRVDGRRYVVDRLFDAAELRFGIRAQTIVRIDHGARTTAFSPRRGGRP